MGYVFTVVHVGEFDTGDAGVCFFNSFEDAGADCCRGNDAAAGGGQGGGFGVERSAGVEDESVC